MGRSAFLKISKIIITLFFCYQLLANLAISSLFFNNVMHRKIRINSAIFSDVAAVSFTAAFSSDFV